MYADAEQNEVSLLSSVNNEWYPVDIDYTNSSRLTLVIDLLGLGYAMQNLQFIGTVKPASTAPLMIRFGVCNDL